MLYGFLRLEEHAQYNTPQYPDLQTANRTNTTSFKERPDRYRVASQAKIQTAYLKTTPEWNEVAGTVPLTNNSRPDSPGFLFAFTQKHPSNFNRSSDNRRARQLEISNQFDLTRWNLKPGPDLRPSHSCFSSQANGLSSVETSFSDNKMTPFSSAKRRNNFAI